jgi:uncharacterized protein (TIGR00369 family)
MFEGKITMTERVWKPLEAVDKHCFGCGCENPHGLQMRFESNGERIRSRLTMGPEFRGWSNLIHGGILSTILDETMGWTVLCLTGKFMLTRGMNVSFRKPVRVGASLTVAGYIREQRNDRKVVVAAEIHDENGDLCAASEGDFALFTREQFLKMEIMPEEDLEAMVAAIS